MILPCGSTRPIRINVDVKADDVFFDHISGRADSQYSQYASVRNAGCALGRKKRKTDAVISPCAECGPHLHGSSVG